MKRIKPNVNINQLLYTLPESTQQAISGGTGTDGSVRQVKGGPYFAGSVTVSDD